MTIREYEVGDVICKEGSEGDFMCEILEGSVAAFKDYGKEGETLLNEMKAGEMFGEVALLESIPRSATVVTLSPGTKIRIISGKEVGDFFQKEPEEIEKILAQLGKKLSSLYGEFRETKAALRAYKKKGEGDENLLREVSKLLSRSLLHPTLPERKPSDAELEARLEQETHEMKYEWEEAVPQKVKTFAPGQVIYREGEEAKNLYFVSGGCVGICHGYGTDKERLVGKIRETQFFGELGWMEGAPRYHTAVALEEDTRVDLISREDLMILTQKFPAFVLLILRDFSTQLRIMTADYQEACKELDAITREERRKRRYPM